MKIRKKYAVYGSCQAPALAKMLTCCPAFANDWELVEIEPCFVASEEQIERHALETLPSLDLFLYQPVSEAYRGAPFSSVFLRNRLPANGVALSVQYMHWEGYHPTVNAPYGLPPHPEGYVDALVAGAIAKRVSRKTYLQRLEEIGASMRIDAQEIGTWCSSELISREAGENDGGKPIDISMTDYIGENWHQNKLFYTMNHPTAALMREVAKQCLMKLGYSSSDIYFDSAIDPLDVTKISIYPIYRDGFNFLETNRMCDFQLLYKKIDYESYFNNQFDWFERSSVNDVSAFFDRLAASRPWLNAALRRAFES